MNRALFDFEPALWLPTRDKTVLEYCRNIKRNEMEITNENGYSIRVVPHPSSAVTAELFNWIYRSDVEDKKTVIVFPNSWRNIYTAAVQMCNRFNVSGRNIHAFCMDEFADEHGNVCPTTYAPGLGYSFMHNFYGNIREDLRPAFQNCTQAGGQKDAAAFEYGRAIGKAHFVRGQDNGFIIIGKVYRGGRQHIRNFKSVCPGISTHGATKTTRNMEQLLHTAERICR